MASYIERNNWHPARLISASRIRVSDEQEV